MACLIGHRSGGVITWEMLADALVGVEFLAPAREEIHGHCIRPGSL